MKKILIVGATSAIAEATARRFAQHGASLFLLARNQERLDGLTNDLKIRGAANVGYAPFDANEYEQHKPLFDHAVNEMGGVDLVLVAHGSLSPQGACEQSAGLTLQELSTNMLSVISMLTNVANYFEAQGSGTIAVISSVAGDRGRQSNYVYGTAKGGLSIFLQGLRNRLYRSGVQVLTIKPGFVDTPMTASFKKGPLWASPDSIAAGIEQAIRKKRDEIYLPGWWAWIMVGIRKIPESVFKKMKL